MIDDWECGFCLALNKDMEHPPDRCERCEMVRCHECATWLKERDGKKSKFCYGCGTISPTTTSRFSRTSSISCCYVEKEWQRRNLGHGCKEIYAVSTGWMNSKDMKTTPKTTWLTKGDDYEHARDLTEEEIKIIKG